MHDIFFFTDIHGCRPLFDAIIKYCYEMDDTPWIIFGGDAIDRGPDGYNIMKQLLDEPHITYLMGNHEDMFTKAAREIKQMFNFENADRDQVKTVLSVCKNFDYKYTAIQDSLSNGGMPTLLDWVMDGMPMDLIEQIEKLPRTISIGNRDFCHSGGVYNTFKRVADCEYDGRPIDPWADEAILWNRSALDIGWAPDRTCIFGHTPTPYLEDYLDKFKWPEDCEITPVLYNRNTIPEMTGWKLDMDTGAVFTGRAFVLNVLTMKAQGFELKDDNQVEKIEVIQF